MFVKLFIITILLFIATCSSTSGSKSKDTTQFGITKKNIMTAESLEDPKRRDLLLNNAYNALKKIEEEKSEDPKEQKDLLALFALYNLIKGDLKAAGTFITLAKSKYKNDLFINTLDTRILLTGRGKSFAEPAIKILTRIVAKKHDIPMAHLVLGDSYFFTANFSKAQDHYKKVLLLGKEYQSLAADRLEIISEIQKIKLNSQKFQHIIFSKAIRRDQIANLLENAFKIANKLKKGDITVVPFTDIKKSKYEPSIKKLRAKGFFTYLKDNQFQPFKNITKGELARIIEDYIVLKSGNSSYRKRYKSNANSPVKELPVSYQYFNAVQIAVKYQILDLPLSGNLNPEELVSGLDVLTILKKMVKKSVYK